MARLQITSSIYNRAQNRLTMESLTSELRALFAKDLDAVIDLSSPDNMKRGCQVDGETLIELLAEDDGVKKWNRALNAFHATYPDAEAIIGPDNDYEFVEHLLFKELDLRGILFSQCRVQYCDFIICDLRHVNIPYTINCYFDCCETSWRALKRAKGFNSYYRERADGEVEPICPYSTDSQ